MIFLGRPIATSTDESCDRVGCSSAAVWLLVGAIVCDACLVEFSGDDGLYDIPLHLLVGDQRSRDARRDRYADVVRDLGGCRRRARDEGYLEQLARLAVDRMFE
jgi:hypothetical protein